jgi:LuxR family maltose regulon positive regulatory protein
LGDFESALAHLNEAQKHYIRSPLPLVRPIPALKALVWIRQGQVQKAQAWADENGLGFDDRVSYIKEFEYLTLARLLLAQVRNKYSQEMLKSAKHLLENLRQDAQANHRTGSLIEILILQAVCFDLDGNIATALQYLEEALVLAEPQAYVQVFIDEGKAIQSLLEKLSEQGIMQQYIAQLLSTRHKAQPQAILDNVLVESLSEREAEVLRLLATELTGPEIAVHLMISLSTMRTHSRNIYSKLSVNGRRSAIRRAQELGLL